MEKSQNKVFKKDLAIMQGRVLSPSAPEENQGNTFKPLLQIDELFRVKDLNTHWNSRCSENFKIILFIIYRSMIIISFQF